MYGVILCAVYTRSACIWVVWKELKLCTVMFLLSFQQESLITDVHFNLTAEFIQNFLVSIYLVAFVHFACTEVSCYLS